MREEGETEGRRGGGGRSAGIQGGHREREGRMEGVTVWCNAGREEKEDDRR